MRVVVLGTGSAGGWPNPFCVCASCCAARRFGQLRGQTSALVDGRLLLDCGADAPGAAERAGSSLAGVRHLLFTHAHPDHCDPAALLYRSWVSEAGLQVLGPAPAIEACRPWLAPASPVRLRALRAGEEVDLDGYRLRALSATHGQPGDALLYDLTGPDRARLLYATDTGPLSGSTQAAVSGRAYDLVLLEETFGDRTDHGTDHLDLETFPKTLSALRRAGAVTDSTDVVAIHLSHHNPPSGQLARRLRAWGARLVDDGAVIQLGPVSTGAPGSAPSRTLVLGGARSGKSRHAERLLAAEPAVCYVATATAYAGDPEWQQRVRDHRARRPAYWTTVETTDLEALLGEAGPPLLVDCLTLWLTAVMDQTQAWDDAGWANGAQLATVARIDSLVGAWRASPRQVVAVSNEVGSGVVPDTAAGRRFRDTLGRLNAALAEHADRVVLCVAGRVVEL